MQYLRLIWAKSLGISHFGSLIILTILTNILMAGLAFISGTLAARLLGPTGRGELAAIQTWPSFLSTIAMLGIPDALVYFSAREPDQSGRWMISAMLITSIACIPFAIGGYIFLPTLISAQSNEVTQAARIYLWLMPIFVIIGIIYHPLRGRNDLIAWNIIRILPSSVWVMILIVYWIIGSANSVILSQVYLGSLALLILPIGFIVFQRIPKPFYPSFAHIKPMMKYGLPSVLSNVPASLNLRMDQMVMAGILDAKSLGLYVVGVAWSGLLSPVLSAVSSVLLPKIAGTQSVEKQDHLLAQSIRFSIPISLVLSALTLVITPWALPLVFGQSYKAAIPAAMLLSVAAGITSINQILSAGALSLGRPRYVLIAESVGFVVTALTLWLLLRSYELVGAAIASILSYGIVLVVLVYLIKRDISLPLNHLLILNQTDISVIGLRWRLAKENLQRKVV